jgi:hypothetical protein
MAENWPHAGDPDPEEDQQVTLNTSVAHPLLRRDGPQAVMPAGALLRWWMSRLISYTPRGRA